MKRHTLLILVVVLAATPLFAETFDSPQFRPVTPEVTAQGDSFSAVARGYNALVTNPAGFAREGGSVTLLSATAQSYFIPNAEEIEALQTLTETPEAAIEDLEEIILNNGFGAAARVGALGLVGRRFGIGLLSDVDIYGRGRTTALGTTVDVASTYGLVGGYAHPFSLGMTTLNVGGAVKILRRAEIREVGLLDLLESVEGSDTIPATIYSGWGLGIDAGVLAERGPWSVSFVLQDIGRTRFAYRSTTGIEDFSEAWGGSGEDEVSDTFAIPMSMTLGVGWDWEPPRFVRFFFDPMVHAEWRPVFYAQEENEGSFWTGLHVGTEVRVLRFIKLRAGINQGYGTVGIGAKVLFMDVNFAYFTRETGRYAGTRPNEGMALEVALRF